MDTALWYLSRATGLVSFVLLSLVVVLGAVLSAKGKVPGLPRFAGVGLHRNVSLLALVLIVIHIVTSVVDPFVSIGWLATVFPFVSHYQPVWMGLGALATDLTIAVIITSLVRFKIGLRLWRAIHWLAYAAWPVSVVHGIGAATELQSGPLFAIVLATIAAVAAAIAWRIRQATAPKPPGTGSLAGAVLVGDLGHQGGEVRRVGNLVP